MPQATTLGAHQCPYMRVYTPKRQEAIIRAPAANRVESCMSGASPRLWHALIRTHHITSRKKVAKLKQAASTHDVFVLLCSGGPPGIMYVEGGERGVEAWVNVVHKLRYKDYTLASRPAELRRECRMEARKVPLISDQTGVHETASVKDFGQQMLDRGVLAWWRKAMGYAGQDERL